MPVKNNNGVFQVTGLLGLPQRERDEYIRGMKARGVFDDNTRLSDMDVVYKRDYLLGKYDEQDLRKVIKNRRDLDEIYRYEKIQEGFDEKFSNPEDKEEYDTLNSKLTPEGKFDLLNNKNYKLPSEINDYQNRLTSGIEEQKNLPAWIPRTGGVAAQTGLYQNLDVSTLSEDDVQRMVSNVTRNSDSALTSIFNEDFKRKQKMVSPLSKKIGDDLYNQIATDSVDYSPSDFGAEPSGQYKKKEAEGTLTSYDKIDEMFSNIASTSPYYNAFSTSNKMLNLTLDEKVKYISDFLAMSSAFKGTTDAQESLDFQIRDYIQENQGFGERAWNDLKNVGVGGVANLMNKVMYWESVGKAIQGQDKLNQFLNGKDENGNLVGTWNNPQYWQGVEQYNTFSAMEIDRANYNNGISPYNNVYRPNEEMKFFGRQALDEAVKMSKFLWSDALLARLFGPVNKGLSKISPTLGKIGVGALGVASAGGIAGAYGIQTYNQTKDKLSQQLIADGEAYASKMAGTNDRENPVYKDAFNSYISDKKRLDAIEAAATNAYLIDSTIEELRMSAANLTYKKWILGKNNNQALRDMPKFSDIVEEGGKFAHRYTTIWPEAFKKMGEKIGGGFWSNYMDDVTVGFGTGFGIGQYNSYIDKYDNPENYVNAQLGYTSNFLEGLDSAIHETTAALTDRQSFFDGFIGGIGGVFGIIPNLNANFSNVKGVGSFLVETIDNPITTSIREATAERAMADNLIAKANEDIAKHGTQLKDIAAVIAAIKGDEVAPRGIKGLKDDDEWKSFILASRLVAWRKDPVMSQSSIVQNAYKELSQLASGNIGEDLINAYLSDKDNATIAERDDSREVASNNIQQNAQKLLITMELHEENLKAFDNSPRGKYMSEDLKNQLSYMLVMNDDWIVRSRDMEKAIRGVKYDVNPSSESVAAAEYGSKQGWQRRIDVQEELINGLEDKLKENQKKLDESSEKLKKFKGEDFEKDKLKYEKVRYEIERQTISDRIELEKENLENIKKDASFFTAEEGGTSEYGKFLTEQEILALSPKQRAWVLDPLHLKDFSKRQQKEIKKTIANGERRVEGFADMVNDAARMQERIDANQVAIDNVRNNPVEAAYYLQTIKLQNRSRAIAAMNQRNEEIAFDWLDGAKTNKELLLRARSGVDGNGNGLSAKVLQKYIDRKPQKANVLKGLIDIVTFESDVASIANETLQDATQRQSVLQTIHNFAEQSGTLAELQKNLEEIFTDEELNKDESLTGTINGLAEVLNKAQEIGYQRAATTTNRRSASKSAKQRKKDDRHAQRVAAMKGDSQKNATIPPIAEQRNEPAPTSSQEQAPQPENAEPAKSEPEVKPSDISTEAEPQVVSPEEGAELAYDPNAEAAQLEQADAFVYTEDGFTTYSPEVGHQVTTSPVETRIDDIDSVEREDIADTVDNDTADILGNAMYEYDVQMLRDPSLKYQIKRQGRVEGDSMNEFFGWLSDRGIKLQNIIDNEVSRILRKNPSVEVHFMTTNKNTDIGRPVAEHEGKDGKFHNMYVFNVVEYTPEIAKIHNEDNGGVIDANGKQWLIIGTIGFAPTNIAQRSSFNFVKDSIRNAANNWFSKNEHANDNYYVSSAYTNVKKMVPGGIARRLVGDAGVQTRSLSELLSDASRNPQNLGIEDLKYLIQEKTKVATIGISNEKYYLPSDVDRNSGGVFLLIRSQNGAYLPAKVQTARFNEINANTEFGVMLNGLIADIASRDFETRQNALGQLRNYLIFNDDTNIRIGDKDNNVITVRHEGMAPVKFDLNDTEFKFSEFEKEVRNADFRINYNKNNLSNPERVKAMDDAGCFRTDLASMVPSNSHYYVYAIDASGKPIIDNSSPVGGTNQPSEFSRPMLSAVVGSKIYRYRQSDKTYVDEKDNVITDSALKTSIYYNMMISQRELSPAYTNPKNEEKYYIISNDATSPIVIKLDKSNNVTVANTQQSADMIARINQINEQHAREKAIEDYSLENAQPSQERVDVTETLNPQQQQQQITDMMLGNEKPKEQPVQQSQPAVEAKPEVKPSSAIVIGGETSSQRDSRMSGTFMAIFTDQRTQRPFLDIIRKKGWEKDIAGKSIGEMMKFLESKHIPVNGITDVNVWLKNIEECK